MKYKEEDYIVNQIFDLSSMDYERVKLYLPGLEHSAFSNKQCIFVFDYYKHNYFFIKSFNEYFTNIPDKIEEPYIFFNSKLHQENVNLVYNIHHRAFNFIFGIEKSKRKNLLLCYNCKMQNNTNEFEMTDFILKLLETDSNGSIWLVQFSINKSKSNYYELPFIQTDFDEKRYLYSFDKKTINSLTDTEQKIIQNIFGDSNNKKIADKLNLKYNTLRSHLKKIYKKINVKDKIELQNNYYY